VITRIAGTDAASPTAPAITQTPGTTYDIMLYQALVNTGGTVTLTDERVYAWVAAAGIATDAVTTAKILAANVTLAKMAADSVDSDQYVDRSIDLAHMSVNSVDSDQYVDGSIDLAHMSVNSVDSDQYVDGSIDYEHLSVSASKVTSRKGGSATIWSTPGTTDYTPTAVRIQVGVVDLTIYSGSVSNYVDVTFPVAFAYGPVIQLTVANTVAAPGWMVEALNANIAAASFRITGIRTMDPSIDQTQKIHWLAIGPA
jgi:hypothetical protein